MPIGKKLYILEWLLFAAALVPAIFAQAVPADARGTWYLAAVALVLASAAVQALRWWGPERYAFTPASSQPEQPAGEIDFDRPDGGKREAETSFRYSYAGDHSMRLLVIAGGATLVLLYIIARAVLGDEEPLSVSFDLAVFVLSIAFRLLFAWPDDKPAVHKPGSRSVYKSGWRSIRSSGNLRKHNHKR